MTKPPASSPSSSSAADRRIVFITSCIEGWGGSEELWAGAAERLRALGFAILALRSRPPSRLSNGRARLAKAGIPLKEFRRSLWTRSLLALQRRLHQWRPNLRRFFEYTPFLRLFGSFGAELVVISQGDNYDGIIGMTNLAEVCDQAELPYVLICQKAYDDLWPSDVDRAVLKRAYTQAQRVYFVSEHNRRCTMQQLSLPLPQAEVVFNPFMVQVEAPLPWPPRRDGVFRVACLARLWARDKGQDLLLTVLAQPAWRERPLEVHFFGSGDTAIGLQEMAATLGLDRVTFHGHVEDIVAVWREHHAILLPSRHEGLPLALVEAMRCGRMGIVTEVGGMPDVVRDGETGFAAHGCGVGALHEVMERAWTRRAEWEQMGLAAARSIREIVPEDPCGVFAERLLEVYQEVTAANRGAVAGK